MIQFNVKKYQGKKRVYTKVKGASDIHRLWVWNEHQQEYGAPPRGNLYEAFRRETINGKRNRVKETFMTVEVARTWQAARDPKPTDAIGSTIPKGPAFGEIVNQWRAKTKGKYESTTIDQYEKKLSLYFQDLMPLSIYEITPKVIDEWIEWLKDPKGKGMKRSTRLTFDHELDVLGVILRFYENYFDDDNFHHPIKDRHREAVKLGRKKLAKRKDLTEAQLQLFLVELAKGPIGHLLVPLTVTQYWHTSRISEASAIHWEDIEFNDLYPERSLVFIRRKVVNPRKAGSVPYVVAGFKNSSVNDGVKEHGLTPETFAALKGLHNGQASGLVFSLKEKPLPYRTIQYYYNRAFESAGLPFTATHVMRHGGCRTIYNSTKGDKHLAGELLGNVATVDTYAKSYKGRQKEWAAQRWEASKAASNR